MRHQFLVILTGLCCHAVADDSYQTISTNIQPLVLTNNRSEEEKCLDMNASSLEYCLQPPDTPASSPLRCFMDEEFVFECNINETTCKDHGSLRGNVKHPSFKSEACPFLQFFMVPQNLLNHHYVCCTPNNTFHLYLQQCTNMSSAPSLPTNFHQLCGGHKEVKTGGVHGGTRTEGLNKPKIISRVVPGLVAVLVAVLVFVAGLAVYLWKSRGTTKPREKSNNPYTLEEGKRMIQDFWRPTRREEINRLKIQKMNRSPLSKTDLSSI